MKKVIHKKRYENNKNLKGQLADRKELFGDASRYAIAPVYTRFDKVSWFVWDAMETDDHGFAQVIRQEDTKERALIGLA